MAYPTGGWSAQVLFAQYIQWAKTQGCTVQSGYAQTPDGETETVTRITSPSGRWVIEVGTRQDEYLTPTGIHYLDRRLGVKSPYFTLDPDG